MGWMKLVATVSQRQHGRITPLGRAPPLLTLRTGRTMKMLINCPSLRPPRLRVKHE